MSKNAKLIAAVSITVIGMAGLYFKIEYSGWVLFVGLVSCWSLT